MANKRMFSMRIVDSDAFLDMPMSSQCLYFHLNMRADDDGFIGNPKRIAKLVGASDDDLKLLIAKRFVLVFESGVIVIKHWRMHNTLSNNRYTETQYLDEKSMLLLKDNNSYSFTSGMPLDDRKYLKMHDSKKDILADEWRTNGGQMADTDIDIDIDKDIDIDIDKGKELKEEKEEKAVSSKRTPIRHQYGEYQNVLLSDEELEKLKAEFPDYQKRIDNLSYYIKSKGNKYKDHLATIRNWARRDRESSGLAAADKKPVVATKSAQAYNNRYKQREYAEDDFKKIEEELFKK